VRIVRWIVNYPVRILDKKIGKYERKQNCWDNFGIFMKMKKTTIGVYTDLSVPIISGKSDFFRRMFLFPFGVEHYSAKNNYNNSCSNKNKQKFVHTYSPSPALKYVPNNRNIRNKITPTIASNHENFSGTAIFPIIRTVTTTCAKFRQVFANPSFCRLLNFMCLIIPKTEDFVKQHFLI